MPVRPRILLGVLLLGCGFAAAARAQAPGVAAADDSLLSALVQEGLANNPAVLSAEEAVQAARSRPQQVEALPYPMFSVQYTNDGWAPTLGEREMTTLGFMASQELPFFGKRGLRGEILRVEADQAAQQLVRVKLGVTASIRRAYAGLRLSRDLLGVVREQSEIWDQIEGIARSRYSVGQASQQDVLRAQVEVSRVAQLRLEQEVEAQVRLAELNQLLARPAEAPLETKSSLSMKPLPNGFTEWFEQLRATSPEIESASLAVQSERLAASLAGKESKPDFAVQAGYMNRGGLDPMWQGGIGVSLPIYRSRAAGAISEAEARVRANQRSAESVALLLRLRTQERVAQIQNTEHIADLYSQRLIPQDRLSVDAALSNYQVGTVPFVAVLEALSTLYSDRSTYLGLLARHEVLRADLEEASLEPSTTGMAAGAAAPQGAMGAAGTGAMSTQTGGGGMR